MLRHCATHYPQALSGQVPPISVLYPDGTREFLDRKLFAETAPHKNIKTYEGMARHVALLAAEDTPLKVLEIGAGTGMLTWQIAPELNGRNVVYHFTDLARTAVQDARQEAAKRQLDHMKFAVLDISKDPEQQEFAERGFDLILGLNVVHATQDLDKTLANLNKLLNPRGTVCLVEYLSTPRWDNMIWGLAEGWWYFDDAYRTKLPLVDLNTWRRAFEQQGFQDVVTFPTDQAQQEATDAGLIDLREVVLA